MENITALRHPATPTRIPHEKHDKPLMEWDEAIAWLVKKRAAVKFDAAGVEVKVPLVAYAAGYDLNSMPRHGMDYASEYDADLRVAVRILRERIG